MTTKASLPLLERLVADRSYQEALQMIIKVLQAIDSRAGRLDAVESGTCYPGSTDEDRALVFATRFAAVFGRLLTEPDLQITAEIYERLLIHYRWIDLIFSFSGFRTSDNFLSLIAENTGKGQLTLQGANFRRLLLMLTMNSFIDVDFDQFWRANGVASAVAFFNYISSRYVFSQRAFDFRERLLEWIPSRLAEVKLGSMTLARLPEVYMHCSYAATPMKHAIKRPLMEQVRRACREAGAVEAPIAIPDRTRERVTVVVVAENLSPGHAVHRVLWRPVQSLRDRFRVVGVIHPDPTTTPIADFFDECIAFPRQDFLGAVRSLAAEITARRPTLILYVGVGMVAVVIALAALRLAPIQCASFGHTATTMSPMIDYFILPEDFVGSPDCFSEKVLALPAAALPFAPRPPISVRRAPPDGTVRVAIPASTMKLNPMVFDAIAKIDAGAKRPVAFQFFPLCATGLPFLELSRVLKERIPRATVFAEVPHDQYIVRLSQCDLFLCPFPYGNMNSIIDSFQLGLPGVCLDGAEAHAHADAAMFARIGLPTELTAKTVDQYVEAAITLIEDQAWRSQCADLVRKADLEAAFFKGDVSVFAAAIEELIWPTST